MDRNVIAVVALSFQAITLIGVCVFGYVGMTIKNELQVLRTQLNQARLEEREWARQEFVTKDTLNAQNAAHFNLRAS